MDFGKYRDDLPVLGFGTFIFIAGASKFVIPEYWIGYEPELLKQLIPLTSGQLMVTGGLFEAAVGVILLSRRKIGLASAIITVWFTAITVQLARLGFWALAIRDFGLTLYALTIYFKSRE